MEMTRLNKERKTEQSLKLKDETQNRSRTAHVRAEQEIDEMDYGAE